MQKLSIKGQQELSKLQARLKVVLEQIENEKLTGDMFTDYKIRMATVDLYCERNRLNQKAYDDFGLVIEDGVVINDDFGVVYGKGLTIEEQTA